MSFFKSYFKFDAQERRGILFLFLIIVVLQLGSMLTPLIPFKKGSESVLLNIEEQEYINAIKEKMAVQNTFTLYPFNPNFVTDYKGYTLGMSPDEIDRLHAFRAANKFVKSAEEFQTVTLVSDSLLNEIAPYFKFPDWALSENETKVHQKVRSNHQNSVIKNLSFETKDLNSATAEDLMVVHGIGKTLSQRIVKFRDRLGGFFVNNQLYDVYGLDVDVVDSVLERFSVLSTPEITPININTASAAEIAKLIYIPNELARNIVAYRATSGRIQSFNELQQIEGFPSEKIDRIKLYLQL
ncbi:helix-hairpin-helix domain-containing protein [Arenibacter sp. GZD96]|uniref:ComEA family DNA-binding protein n=1 Tax=Aurantibrevibacter litoralis TaxID=3106030 RepID=UPI002AFF9D60|nr:helix-hairpin-helix domain-containing protein [Arenibacter sp. GZD-96]MEA1786808.1 helix-hairpin-helix domain-containing protein [Arenibacter sp. GZD-96]